MSNENVRGFFDYTADDLNITVPKGTYKLEVTRAEVDEWDDGRPRLDVSTQICEGEHAGKFGPRLTFSLGDFDGETAAGKAFHVDGEAEKQKLIRAVRTMHENRPALHITFPTKFDAKMLDEIARQIVSDTFIATVNEGKDGYLRVGRIFPLSDPPKSYKGATSAAAFSLDSI